VCGLATPFGLDVDPRHGRVILVQFFLGSEIIIHCIDIGGPGFSAVLTRQPGKSSFMKLNPQSLFDKLKKWLQNPLKRGPAANSKTKEKQMISSTYPPVKKRDKKT